MRLRKLDLTPDPATGVPAYDMSFGRGSRDYWQNVPDAPAQLVLQRMELWQGQWFLDTSDGMPWRTQVLGRGTDSTRDRAIQARILATQGVTGISTYASQVNRDTRADATQVTLTTAYDADVSAPVAISGPMADVRYAR